MLVIMMALVANVALLLGFSRLIDRDQATWELVAFDAYELGWFWVYICFSAILSCLEAEIYLNWGDPTSSRRVNVDSICVVVFVILFCLWRYFKLRALHQGRDGEHPVGIAILALAAFLAISWLILHRG